MPGAKASLCLSRLDLQSSVHQACCCKRLLRLPSVVPPRAEARQWALKQACCGCIDHRRGFLQNNVSCKEGDLPCLHSRLAGVLLLAVQPSRPACKPGGAVRIQPLLGVVRLPLQHRPAQAVAEGPAPGQSAGPGAAPEWGGAGDTGDQDASPTSSNRSGLYAHNQLSTGQMGPPSDWLQHRAAGALSGVLSVAQCCFFASTTLRSSPGHQQGQHASLAGAQ